MRLLINNIRLDIIILDDLREKKICFMYGLFCRWSCFVGFFIYNYFFFIVCGLIN